MMKLSSDAVIAKASADPAGSSEAEMALENCDRWGKGSFYLHTDQTLGAGCARKRAQP